MTRRLAAIMFTDIAGYTAMTQEDEAGALRLLRDQNELIGPVLEAHKGRRVKSIGDGLLIEFPNALDAIECAMDIQQRVHQRNARGDTPALRMRVGIHLGDVQEESADILGDAVNIASRIEPLAEPGGVSVSFPVYDQVHNKVACEFEKLGPKRLKGVRDPVDIYRIVFPWSAPGATPGGPLLPRVAVLPLANISPDSTDAYFADGLTEELISVLSQVRGLRVISHTSVNQYKGTTKPIVQIGSELGADTVLEGSVRKAGDQLRISVQLIDARTDEHRWSQTYDRKFENVFAIQADVAEQTAGALKVELLRPERAALHERPTATLPAYEAYLRGLSASRGFDYRVESDRQAAEYFESAIREDPRFAAAYAALANHLIMVEGVTRSADEVFPKARELATTALDLDPDSAEAHTALGNLAMQADLDWTRSEAEFDQAISLNPSSSEARCGLAVLFISLQRYDEAKEHLLAAIQVDPLRRTPREWMLGMAEAQGDWESALRHAQYLAATFNATLPEVLLSQVALTWAYAYAGRVEEAMQAQSTWADVPHPLARVSHALLLAYLGNPLELRSSFDELAKITHTEFRFKNFEALAYAVLHENDKALACLEGSFRRGENPFWYNYNGPLWDSIRDNPRFIALLRSMRLPTSNPRRMPAAPGSR
jgi:adenylate cyclase